MSDNDHDSDLKKGAGGRHDREGGKPATEFDDHTAIRQTPNADKTAVRGGKDAGADLPEARAETLVRGSSTTRHGGNPDGAESIQSPLAGGQDETVIRGRRDGEPESETSPDVAGSADRTVLRDEGLKPAADDDATIIKGSGDSAGSAAPANDSATILRGGSGGASDDSATILRGAGAPSNENATILRGGAANEHATILRGAGAGDDATVMRGGGDDGGDSTVMRDNRDDDSTIINHDGDGDKTVIGRDGDTTYVASESGGGRPASRNRGNSEAGRLLKNRFVLEEKVGSGGMGDVYKALDLRQQEAQERNPYIAIKILNDDFARHKDAFISLQREATRTRGIPHPNIMAVYDFDKEGETVFMSMELLDGKPLDDYLRDHPEGVSVEDAWNIIDGICQGLSRAHGAGIVHSDFKPGNIYYCVDKTAKVFDFGIARAVANPGDIKADGEKTVFDAGSLGALTPTYASYEMLVGKEPTKSDDVYAVALVAYELFTGKHPYNRTPADKALERGLEPEPVKFLKRRHWRALKKGLALKGEDRYQSIDELYEDLFSEDPPYFRYAAIAAVLVASVGFGAYNFLVGPAELPAEFQEWEGLYTSAEQRLIDAVGSPDQTLATKKESWRFEAEDWREETLRQSLARMVSFDTELMAKYPELWDAERSDAEECDSSALDAGSESTACTDKQLNLLQWRDRLLTVYLTEVEEIIDRAEINANEEIVDPAIDASQLDQFKVERMRNEMVLDQLVTAETYLSEAASRYNVDEDALAGVRSRLESELTLANEDLRRSVARVEAEEAEIEAQRLAAEAAEERRVFEERRNAVYLALREESLSNPESLARIMRCKGELTEQDLTDLDTVLNGPGQITLEIGGETVTTRHSGMRGEFPGQFELDRPGIVTAISGCISRRIAPRDPELAREVQQRVQNMLPPEDAAQIAAITIEDLDPCAQLNLVGRGSVNGSWCSDKLSVDGTGPELVVVPAPSLGGEKFAISRLEVKRSDYNRFCEETGCARVDGPGSLPVTNISLAQAQAYTEWLSYQTGREYRLPTVDEWRYAATTNLPRDELEIDDNVNCFVDARGVRLGDTLLSTLSGKPNRWGLYNYIGNAQEWAVADDGDGVIALGGAHVHPKSECTFDKQVAHGGNPDPVTGFRIVRPVESSS